MEAWEATKKAQSIVRAVIQPLVCSSCCGLCSFVVDQQSIQPGSKVLCYMAAMAPLAKREMTVVMGAVPQRNLGEEERFVTFCNFTVWSRGIATSRCLSN